MEKLVPERNREKMQRHRSPNYPAISLKRAVELATSLYEKDKTHPVPIAIAASRWGLKAKGSQADLLTAALKAYGLIEAKGSAHSREISVTELARRVILDAEDRADILRRAALSPRVHREIWDYYKGELPQDDVLRNHLIFKMRFNENAVDGFITQIRETVTYSQIANPHSISVEDSHGNDEDRKDVGTHDVPLSDESVVLENRTKKATSETTHLVHQQLRFIVPSGEIIMMVPREMTKSDFQILSSYLKAYEQAIPISIPGSSRNGE